jgi:hypothetical protein
MSDRRPSYKTLVNALDAVLGMDTASHCGDPPSWDKNCPKCATVRKVKDILERAKRKRVKRKPK